MKVLRNGEKSIDTPIAGSPRRGTPVSALNVVLDDESSRRHFVTFEILILVRWRTHVRASNLYDDDGDHDNDERKRKRHETNIVHAITA